MALADFVSKNVKENVKGNLTKGLLLFDVANLTQSEHKIKSIFSILRDLVASKAVQGTFLTAAFLGMAKAVRSIVHETGSLQAALNKLTQIQGLQKTFTGLVGGAEAAKRKVAELVNFAATKKISLGDAGEASRSLLITTKGAFSTVSALDTVNDAAKATGNNVVGLADAVGDFSMALREGGSIEGATEKLRQMGVINDTTAASFIRLEKSGASTGELFTSLVTSLEQFKGGATDAEDSIEGVNAAYEKASANLQEKFGSPWVESDISNTKNYIEAMNAVAPSVARVSKFFEFLTNGFSNIKSGTIQVVSSTAILRGAFEGLVYVMGTAITVAGALGAISLGRFFADLSVSIRGATSASILGSTSMGVLGKALSFLGVSGGTTEKILTGVSNKMSKLIGVSGALSKAFSFVPLIAVGVTLGGMVYKWVSSFEAAAKALQEVQKGQSQEIEKIRQLIANVHTLADAHDAVTAALQAELKARQDLIEAEATGDKDKIAAAEAALDKSKSQSAKAIARAKKPTESTSEELEAMRRDLARAKEEKDALYQEKLNLAKPAEKAELMKGHIAGLGDKINRGQRSEEATVQFSRAQANADLAATTTQGQLDNARKEQEAAEARRAKLGDIQDVKPGRNETTAALTERNNAKIAAADKAIADAKAAVAAKEADLQSSKKAQAKVGAAAPLGTTTEIRSRLREAQLDPKRVQEVYYIQRELEAALQEEKETGANRIAKMEEKAALMALERQNTLSQIQVRNEADLQDATLRGDGKKIQRLKDLGVFQEKYQEMRDAGYSEKEAKSGAGKFASNAIDLSGTEAMLALNGSAVADSLARIGGGGNVYTPGAGADPMLSQAQRQTDLLEDSLKYLEAIAKSAGGGVL